MDVITYLSMLIKDPMCSAHKIIQAKGIQLLQYDHPELIIFQP